MGRERIPGRVPEGQVNGMLVRRACATCGYACYAPTFGGDGGWFAWVRRAAFSVQLAIVSLVSSWSPNNAALACRVKRMRFQLTNWDQGNWDPWIDLDGDSWSKHVRRVRSIHGKSEEWERWMIATADRWAQGFRLARTRPAVIVIAFDYYPGRSIAYDPPWSSEVEHMTALKRMAELGYPCYEFQFAFRGDTSASYANVVAAIPTNSSHQAGKTLNLYYETIFIHEFGHVMGIPHHYDDLPVDPPLQMPPGETLCIMARNSTQWCSACRTALCIPLDVDTTASLDAAMDDVMTRYP